SATGSFSNQGQKRLNGTADINLAEIFTQLPHTLKLRKDIKLSQGKLLLSADVKSADEVTAFDGTARIDKIAGVSKGKKLIWNKPIFVKARGERAAQEIRLDNLSLRSSFLNADGKGDLSNMQITLSADLAAALRELKKFIDIREWSGSGKLFAKLHVKETSPQLNTAALDLDTRDLALSRNGRPILPKQDVKADLSSRIQKGKDLADSEFREPNLTIESSITRGKFSASRFKIDPDGDLPLADNLSIDGHFNLQQLSDLLRNFNKLSKDKRLAGSAHIQTSGSLDAQQLVLKNTRVVTRNFKYRDGQKTLREDRLTIQTKGKLNFKTKSVLLAPLDINASPGKLTIPELTIRDWSNFQKDLKTQAEANLDLAKLTNTYGDFIRLPEKTRISGKGKFDLDVDFSSSKAQFLTVNADLSPFQLTSETLPPISENHVKLRADLKRSPDGKALTIENIQLNSTPLSLSAAGNYDQAGKKKTLAASGNINLDLKMLSPYLKKIAGPQITISGKGDNPFKLKMISRGTRWTDSLKNTDFTGAIRADAIDAFGLGISATEVPIRVADEAAIAKLAATANGGQLKLQPTIDLKKQPYTLSLPQNSFVLKNVQITDAMAERLLALIHPLFKGSTNAEGQIDLHMKHFDWPLAKQNRNDASFAGTLSLRDVRINSTNLLSGLLSLIRMGGSQLEIDNLDVEFVAQNGRIKTSPIRFEIGGYPVELNGSVGFDKSIDYVATLPITSALVGNDAFGFLEGTTIDVPIRGTSSDPNFNEAVMQKATESLVQQVLQKGLQKGLQGIFEKMLPKK
ncbi:MAG: AsmA-like C-terminal region-containing protein, partial [Desulfobacterales bacterium]